MKKTNFDSLAKKVAMRDIKKYLRQEGKVFINVSIRDLQERSELDTSSIIY